MPISFSRYVAITSGVAGASLVATRQLIGRIFSNNPLLPPGSFLTFSGGPTAALAEVGNYFGFASVEYARALFYFGWVSKSLTQAQAISFARWTNVAVAPLIYGDPEDVALATFNSITAGSFTLTLNGAAHTLGPFNFSASGSLAAVASTVQAAINGVSGTLWSAAQVNYDATRGSFQFVGGVAGACTVLVTDGTQNVAAALGWTSPFPATIIAEGAAAETVTQTLTASAIASNNFGSFLFMPTLTQDQMAEASAWTKAQNVLFRYCQRVSAADAADISDALIANGGTDLILAPLSNEYPEMCPMIEEAATDYTARDSTSDYMFQQFDLTPSVDNDTDANTYDGLRVNYYGITQESGQPIAFYQRGVMMGGVTDPVDENVFSNESWLKSDAAARVINLQLGLPKLGANAMGETKLTNALMATVELAKFNGTISIGKPLTSLQIASINTFTGDVNAWRQVQNSGFWLQVRIVPYTDPTNNLPGYKAVYTLVYSKDDVVRFVSGTHVLI